MTDDEAARLSKLLWDARELAEMYADMLAIKHGRAPEAWPESWPRQLMKDIDAYRAERGWSPDGFGGETDG